MIVGWDYTKCSKAKAYRRRKDHSWHNHDIRFVDTMHVDDGLVCWCLMQLHICHLSPSPTHQNHYVLQNEKFQVGPFCDNVWIQMINRNKRSMTLTRTRDYFMSALHGSDWAQCTSKSVNGNTVAFCCHCHNQSSYLLSLLLLNRNVFTKRNIRILVERMWYSFDMIWLLSPRERMRIKFLSGCFKVSVFSHQKFNILLLIIFYSKTLLMTLQLQGQDISI